MPMRRTLRELAMRWCRTLGPPALAWSSVVLVARQYGDLLQQRLPEWAFNLGYSFVMIGAVIPFLAIFTFPFAIYAAIRLRREPWLALSCALFAACGALLTLAGLGEPFEGITEMLGWPVLCVAALTATWTGYRRRTTREVSNQA